MSFAAEQRGDVLGPVAPGSPPTGAARCGGGCDGHPARDGTNTVIDMLILYTPESRANNGGVSGMNALINASVAKANLAFANSQAGCRCGRPHAEVAYTSMGPSATT